MSYQRVHKSSTSTSQPPQKTSHFGRPPVIGQPEYLSHEEQEMPIYTMRSADWVMENNLLSGMCQPPPIQAKLKVGESEDKLGQETENKTGLPDNLKTGIETLSGLAMDDVRVYYNSPKPIQLQALAYTQGTEIHVAPGQEKHLPHEAWHVVQQIQGRVKPTMQMKGVAINAEETLEKEADLMGQKACRVGWLNPKTEPMLQRTTTNYALRDNQYNKVVQKNGFNPYINEINWNHIEKFHFPGQHKGQNRKSVFLIGKDQLKEEIQILFDFHHEKRNTINITRVNWQIALSEDMGEPMGWDQDGKNFTKFMTIIIKILDVNGKCDVINAYPSVPS